MTTRSTDPLTRVQDALDQLNTQFYASLRYISTHHSASPLPAPTHNTGPDSTQTTVTPIPLNDALPPDQIPDDPPEKFAAAQAELAHDLVIQYTNIKRLIETLPGTERSTEEQEKSIAELEGQLVKVRQERAVVEEERRKWIGNVEDLMGDVRR